MSDASDLEPDFPPEPPARPPLARRVPRPVEPPPRREPRRREPERDRPRPSRRGGWWWLALALTGLVVLVLGVTAVVALANSAATPRVVNPSIASVPPPALTPINPGAGGGGPPPVAQEVDPAQVKQFLLKFGTATRDPQGMPEALFDFSDLLAAVPSDAADPKPARNRMVPAENRFARQAITDEMAAWKKWDWAKADVRKVVRRADGTATEAIVWHPTPDGKVVRLRWTFADDFNGLRVMGWEDLRTGVTAHDLTYAHAVTELGPTQRRRRQWQFTQVRDLHRLIDQRKWDEAEKELERLKAVRFDPELMYSLDLAEGRLAANTSDESDYEDEGILSAEVFDELIAKHPERLAAYPALAEANLKAKEYARAEEACDAYLSVAGDDPDVLAVRGAARLALVRTEDAAADFAAALALDRHQPRGVNWLRQQADAKGKAKVADRLATAPDPAGLFDALAGWAEADADWPGLLALAERYRALKPKDTRWAGPLVVAHARSGHPDDAAAVLKAALPVMPEADRSAVVQRFAWAMIAAEKAEEAYALVPPAEAAPAFRVLAEHFHARGLGRDDPDNPLPKEERQTAVEALKALIAAHRQNHPADWRLALHDARLKAADGQYADAAKILEPAIARITYTGDYGKDYQSGYQPLKYDLITALYKTGRGLDAYRMLKPQDSVFQDLARRYAEDKDADGLGKLLDEQVKAEGETPDTPFWRAEVHRLAGRPADAAKLYRQYLKAATADEFQLHSWEARTSLIRCLVRSNNLPAAAREVDLPEANGVPLALRAVVLAKGGKTADAEQTLRTALKDGNWLLASFYADDDLGPILKGPEFARFRRDFPPPADKPKPDR